MDRYERGSARNGYRSGYKPGYLDTAEGRVQVAIPQVRDSEQSYRCTLYDVLRAWGITFKGSEGSDLPGLGW